MKDVDLCTVDVYAIRKFHGPARATERKEGRRGKGGEDGRRSAKCEIKGIGHETEKRARVATHNAISRESNGSRA